jgi:hypothetical protein
MQRIMVIDPIGIKLEIANALFLEWNNRQSVARSETTRLARTPEM